LTVQLPQSLHHQLSISIGYYYDLVVVDIKRIPYKNLCDYFVVATATLKHTH